MVALGFQNQQSRELSSPSDALNSIIEDGAVTLDEFTTMMKGELSGRHPFDEVREVYAVLSRSDGQEEHKGRITLDKLRQACRDFRLRLSEDEITTMMREVDRDGGGSIEEEEFMRIMRMSAWF